MTRITVKDSSRLLVGYHRIENGPVRTWIYEPHLRPGNWPGPEQELVLDINPPISYYVKDLLDPGHQELKEFCIDAGGRNHGVEGPVYVNYKELLTLLKRLLWDYDRDLQSQNKIIGGTEVSNYLIQAERARESFNELLK